MQTAPPTTKPKWQALFTNVRTIIGVSASLVTITGFLITYVVSKHNNNAATFNPGTSCKNSTGKIIVPTSGAGLVFGNQYTFTASTKDPSGNPIPDANLQWYTGFPSSILMGTGASINFTFDNRVIDTSAFPKQKVIDGDVRLFCADPTVSFYDSQSNKLLDDLKIHVIVSQT